MCDPVSLLLAGATAVGAYGQIQAADAAAEAAQVQGESINRQAGQELDAANSRAEQIRKAARRQAGEARAAFSASGVSVDEGTPIKVSEEIMRGGEYDALATILSGSRSAQSMSDEAVNVVRQGQAAKQAGYMSAFGSVLSGGYKAADSAGWVKAPKRAPIVDKSIRVNG